MKTDITNDSDPYQQGWDDFFSLLDKDQNPYPLEKEIARFDWKAGWETAAKVSDRWPYKFPG